MSKLKKLRISFEGENIIIKLKDGDLIQYTKAGEIKIIPMKNKKQEF